MKQVKLDKPVKEQNVTETKPPTPKIPSEPKAKPNKEPEKPKNKDNGTKNKKKKEEKKEEVVEVKKEEEAKPEVNELLKNSVCFRCGHELSSRFAVESMLNGWLMPNNFYLRSVPRPVC